MFSDGDVMRSSEKYVGTDRGSRIRRFHTVFAAVISVLYLWKSIYSKEMFCFKARHVNKNNVDCDAHFCTFPVR